MFRSARWRTENNRINAVFKLQFHATQVPYPLGDPLILSLIPVDTGRLTLRLEKSTFRDGCCYWENPVYETIKFMQDSKSGKICKKVYEFHVSNGMSKACFVGDASIDFADYVGATKPSSVSLPLKNSSYEAILHVSIQRTQDNDDQSGVEESEVKIKPQDRSLRAQLSFEDTYGSINSNSTDDGSFYKINGHGVEPKINPRQSSGSDLTISSSDSSSGFNTPHELRLKDNIIPLDRASVLSSPINTAVPQNPASHSPTTYGHKKSQWDWPVGSVHESCTDISTNSSGDVLPVDKSHQGSGVSPVKLKNDILVLSRQVELSEIELQTLRKQIIKECKRGQELSKEVFSLKQERDAVKEECEKLKAVQNHTAEAKVKNKLQFEGGDPLALFQELRQELSYEKDQNANLRLQLQKTQESNNELILAVQDLDEMIEQKNKELGEHCNKSVVDEKMGEVENLKENVLVSQTTDDEEQMALEELVKGHRATHDSDLLEQKVIGLCNEIDIYRRDKDELEMQMEQLALDYEILKQENHDLSYKLEQSQLQEQLRMQYECSGSFATISELEGHIESLENQLQKQSHKFSESLASINELESHVKSLEEELQKQAQGFEADLEYITCAKVEQEQRAIRAEEALRNTRWRNASTAERLQEEFRRLSMQMASTFDSNEKLAMKALAEANDLRLEKRDLEELLQKANDELQSIKDCYEAKLLELSEQTSLKSIQMEQMSEIEKNSKQLKNYKKQEEEFSKEILLLKTAVEELKADNYKLCERVEQAENLKVELEQLKKSIKETEMLKERGDARKSQLEDMVASLKAEVDKSVEESSNMRRVKDEKEKAGAALQLEVEIYKAQCKDLKVLQFEDDIEKEKLRKQVLQLKEDLKEEDSLMCTEKKLKDSNEGAVASDGIKATSRTNNLAPVAQGSKEVATFKEKETLLEGEIKIKESAFETSTKAFLEKENDLLKKNKELEKTFKGLNHSSSVAQCFRDIISNVVISEEGKHTTDVLTENGSEDFVDESDELVSKKYVKTSPTISARNEGHLFELSTDKEQLKERNKLMEIELKEMQERYSEISLKFAEVESERQMLVMTLRNLKNAIKC